MPNFPAFFAFSPSRPRASNLRVGGSSPSRRANGHRQASVWVFVPIGGANRTGSGVRVPPGVPPDPRHATAVRVRTRVLSREADSCRPGSGVRIHPGVPWTSPRLHHWCSSRMAKVRTGSRGSSAYSSVEPGRSLNFLFPPGRRRMRGSRQFSNERKGQSHARFQDAPPTSIDPTRWRLHAVLALVVLLGASYVEALTLTASDLRPGDLVITEIMQNPAAVPDSAGEWFEVCTPGRMIPSIC